MSMHNRTLFIMFHNQCHHIRIETIVYFVHGQKRQQENVTFISPLQNTKRYFQNICQIQSRRSFCGKWAVLEDASYLLELTVHFDSKVNGPQNGSEFEILKDCRPWISILKIQNSTSYLIHFISGTFDWWCKGCYPCITMDNWSSFFDALFNYPHFKIWHAWSWSFLVW